MVLTALYSRNLCLIGCEFDLDFPLPDRGMSGFPAIPGEATHPCTLTISGSADEADSLRNRDQHDHLSPTERRRALAKAMGYDRIRAHQRH